MPSVQKLPNNVGDLGKLIVVKGLKKLLKVKKIAQSGHTGGMVEWQVVLQYQQKVVSSRESPQSLC